MAAVVARAAPRSDRWPASDRSLDVGSRIHCHAVGAHPLSRASANREPSSPTPRVVAAIVDRITFEARILKTDTQ